MSSGSCALSARVSVVDIVRECDLRARHLTERVDARIGTACAVHSDRRAFEACERILEQALHGVAFGLPLPADESRAVVREREFESRCADLHGRLHPAPPRARLHDGLPGRAERAGLWLIGRDRDVWQARDTARRGSAARRCDR